MRKSQTRQRLLILIASFALLMWAVVATSQDDDDPIIFSELEGSVVAIYDVEDSALILVEGEYEPFHDELWAVYTDVIPEHLIDEYVEGFEVFTDLDEGLAYVYPGVSLDRYVIGANPNDEADEVIATAIHEFAHILTLNTAQVTPYESWRMSTSERLFNRLQASEQQRCTTVALQDACALDGSYIADFYERFWLTIEEDWLDAPDDLIYLYPDHFVTDYASTNFEEDLAESFAAFVIWEPVTVTDRTPIYLQKAAFFYDYPELVKLRMLMRHNIKQLGVPFASISLE